MPVTLKTITSKCHQTAAFCGCHHLCHTYFPFHKQLKNCSRKLRRPPRPQSKHISNALLYLIMPEATKFWRRHSESYHEWPCLYSFIIFINKVYYNGALICITTDHYKILHIRLRTRVILRMQGCSRNSLPTSRLASGALTTGAGSCFPYSSHVPEAVLCVASTDGKRTQFWDSLHDISGRIKDCLT